MWHHHFFGGMGWGIWFIPAVIIFIVFLILKYKPRTERPLEILKKRYAKGEISKEEFELRKKDILS